MAGTYFGGFKAWAKPSDCAIKMDLPTSLAIGTVRTPEFRVKHKVYRILLRVESNAPMRDVSCLLGTDWSSIGIKCDKEPLDQEPIIEGTWIIWDGANKVAEGSVSGGDGNGETPYERELGHFIGEAKKSYTLEVTFTKDGGPLKGMNPHLVVRQDYDFGCSPM